MTARELEDVEMLTPGLMQATDAAVDADGKSVEAAEIVTADTTAEARRARLSEAKLRLLQKRISGLAAEQDEDRVRPRAAGAVVPLSAEQRRVWLHASQQPDLPLYNESITIHYRGILDAPALEGAFNEILARHEAWRTSFSATGEQIIHPQLAVRLAIEDLSHLSPDEREREALRMATEDARTPLRLDELPLFRARLLRMAPEEHRLCLTLHHIIFDGVSIYRILMPELAAIYRALAGGEAHALPQPALQYADYTLWRERHVLALVPERKLDYWREQLKGELPVLQLPGQRVRPASSGANGTNRDNGAMEYFSLDADLVEGLRGLSRQQCVTLYMTLLAAFKTLLFRYSGQTDMIVGGATDARRRPELEPVMGYFLDTFAMRTRPNGGLRFNEYLVEIRDCVLGALAAAEVPFDRVVQAVNPRRDGGHHPIFQAFFSIEPPAAPFGPEWHLTQMDVPVRSAKFDLYLELDDRPERMEARFLYSTQVLDRPTVCRMIGHWLTLLRGVVEHPAATLGELPMLTAEELGWETGPGSWNDTATPVPAGTVQARFAEMAARSPGSVAVLFGEDAWSYAQLEAQAGHLAERLREMGATRGSLVGLLLERSLQLPAAMLAVLRLGAAYLPLDPDTPVERLRLVLDDARPIAVMTDDLLETKLCAALPERPGVGVLNVRRTEAAAGLEGVPVSRSPAAAAAEGIAADTAYVIYTSGTTGEPKAVEISQASLMNLLCSMAKEPGFAAADRLLAVTTIAFDIAALELLLPLITGGSVVVAAREEVHDARQLALAIERTGATVMQATPTLWRTLLLSGWDGAGRDSRRVPLRMFAGGETLPRELATRLLATGGELWNLYGPTETTIWSMVDRVEPERERISVGHPIANTVAHILTREGQGNGLQLVPVGVQGELYLGGTGLAKGYRGQAAKTAERFFAVAAVGGVMVYRTGDLAVRREDGSIEIQGRIDHQVKIRGFRVELQAVEAALLRHPAVAAAAVRTWPDSLGGLRLSAYVVARDGFAAPAPEEIRSFLARSLPAYQVPSDVVSLDRLPVNTNGKIDRGRLPEPATQSGSALAAAAAGGVRVEANPMEQRVAALWSELLAVAAVGPEESFFDLGGHSLLVAVLQGRIEVEFGVRLPMGELFSLPTVRQQAEWLQRWRVGLAGEDRHHVPGYSVDGARAKMFWFHSSGLANRLANQLGEDQPLFDLSLSTADVAALGEEQTVGAIAAFHVRQIFSVQPHGPYVLGGYCNGGIVAYETAAQLRSAGHEVALLVMLDAHNPAVFRTVGSFAVEVSKLRFYFRRLFRGEVRQLTSRLQNRSRHLIGRSAAVKKVMTEDAAVFQVTHNAALHYAPPSYAGRVLLLQGRDRPSGIDRLPEWSPLIEGRLHAEEVPGHHDEALRPDRIARIAGAVRRHVDDATGVRVAQAKNGRL